MIETIKQLINEQIEENNTNKRFNKVKLIEDLTYCYKVAESLLSQVLNKGYFPLMNDEQIEHVKHNQTLICIANLLFPYFYDSTFINEFQHNIEKQLETYYVEQCLLYLRDYENTYNNMVRYLEYTFLNLI